MKKEAPKEICLLDGKRAMNTSIAIARIKMSYAETRQAIMNMEETALSSNVLQSLQVCSVFFRGLVRCKGFWRVRLFTGVALRMCVCVPTGVLSFVPLRVRAAWVRARIRVCARGKFLPLIACTTSL